jgi:F420-0:gamma-glutamyl ligase
VRVMPESPTAESTRAPAVRIGAKPGTVEAVREFPPSARSLAGEEDDTTTRVAAGVDETAFEGFETVPDEPLASAPKIEERDALAATHP